MLGSPSVKGFQVQGFNQAGPIASLPAATTPCAAPLLMSLGWSTASCTPFDVIGLVQQSSASLCALFDAGLCAP
jgi:hypothetical protein